MHYFEYGKKYGFEIFSRGGVEEGGIGKFIESIFFLVSCNKGTDFSRKGKR